MLTSRLDTIAASLDEEIDSPVEALAKMIVQEAKARVPYSDEDDVHLRDAIHIQKDSEGIYSVIAGDDKAFYGHIIEYGGVDHTPHPFLIPAFEAVRDRADELVKAHFKDL